MLQLEIWKRIQEGLEKDRCINFDVDVKSTGVEINHGYSIIGYEKINSHYFLRVVNPWDTRDGLTYFNVENMKSKSAISTFNIFSDKDYFLLELSHFIDLLPRLSIV